MPRIQAWQPDTGRPEGPQRRFLVDMADVFEVLNAGSVGSGKTDAGLMAMVVYPEYRKSPAFKGLVLRHAAKDLAVEFYQRVLRPNMWPRYVGGQVNETKGIYRFSRGGRVTFSTSKDLRSLQGPEFQCVWFDELTHWPTDEDYRYVVYTRCRSAQGLPIRIRAGTNAGGPGHAWVKAWWGPWLARDYLSQNVDGQDLYAGAASLRALGYEERRAPDGSLLPPCDSGEVLHYVFDEQGRFTWVPPGTPGALTRTCLRTQTKDNVAMQQKDAGYQHRVRGVGGALALQLGKDDWNVLAKEGDQFERVWFPVVAQVPRLDGVVRRWDFAYTIGPDKKAKKKRDWTVGLKLGWVGPPQDRRWYLLHIVRDKQRPEVVAKLVRQTAETDTREVPVIVPVDYAAGHWVVSTLQAALAGFVVQPHKEVGAKEIRIQTLIPQAQAERIHLLVGPWNAAFLDEAAMYPNLQNDDQLDALAGAFLWSLDGKAPPSPGQVQADVVAARKISPSLAGATATAGGAAGTWAGDQGRSISLAMRLLDHARRAADLLSGGLTLLRSLPAKAGVRRVLIPGVDYPAGIVGVQEIPVYGFSDWKMPQVQQVLDAIKVGSLQGAHQLMLQLQEDPLAAHGMALRVGSLVGTPFDLVRPAGLPAWAYQALVAHWPECFSDGDLATSAEYRVMLGVAPAQVTWHLLDDLWMPRIRVMETGNLTWDVTLRRFRFSSLDKGEITIEDDGREWVLFSALAGKHPYLYGALRSLAVVWWIKAACLRYLHNFARVHGSPIRKVKAPASQRESADFKALIEQAQNLFGGGVFTAPQYDGPSFDLELVEAKSEGGSVFATAIKLADSYITLRLLGAVDNTSGLSGQGSRARAEVHERQAVKFLGTDCRVTAASLSKVLRQWCAYNRFPIEWAPFPRFDHAPPADQSELADVRQKNAQALSTLVQTLLPAPAAPAGEDGETLSAPATQTGVQAALQAQAPDVRIDWRRLLEQHGVPLLEPDELAVQAALDQLVPHPVPSPGHG